MEQFRQIGEVLGSLKALMVFRDDIQINNRQCSLLLDMFSFAYESIAEEMKQNLRFEEKQTKWKVLEQPLKELHRVFKEGEVYIKQSLETKDFWAKSISLYRDTDCVEFHIHDLLSCIPIVVEAIESAGEISGWDQDEMQKRRVIYSMKYQRECKDPKLFQWIFGKQYLVSQDFCSRLAAVWEEDRWILLNKIKEKRKSGITKHERQLADLVLKNLNDSEALNYKLLPFSILVGSKDYQVKRRLGSGSQFKEIQWLGESFAMRHFFGNIERLIPDISKELSLSHPNIMQIHCGFTDEEKKECFLVMELMNRDLSSYIKEICGPRKRNPFSIPVAVDLMLQISRGMEYLHSQKIYHGDLNPKNILVKVRNVSTEGYLHAKITGFGLSPTINQTQKPFSNQNEALPFIWHAPEILAEQEQMGSMEKNSRYTEKGDVYSFGMICFELLTGKVPFEDSHLQGDKMSRNIRTGVRPLFPFPSPKYLTNLTKKCWHNDPNQRPSFSSICRILRYIKKFLVLNPELGLLDPPTPMVDFCEIEAGLLKKFSSSWGNLDPLPVSEIPFQMFAYRVVVKERTNTIQKDTSESGSDGASACGDENVIADETLSLGSEKKPFASTENQNKKLSSLKKKSPDVKANKHPGTPKGRSLRPPQLSPSGRSMRMNSESQLTALSPKPRRTSGHVSDSELS